MTSGSDDPRSQDHNAPLRRLFFGFFLFVVMILTWSGLSSRTEGTRFLTLQCLAISAVLALVVALIYGRGYRRTFCIGAIFPAGWIAVWLLRGSMGWGAQVNLYAAVSLLSSPYGFGGVEWTAMFFGLFGILLFGVVAVAVRWLVEPRKPE